MDASSKTSQTSATEQTQAESTRNEHAGTRRPWTRPVLRRANIAALTAGAIGTNPEGHGGLTHS